VQQAEAVLPTILLTRENQRLSLPAAGDNADMKGKESVLTDDALVQTMRFLGLPTTWQWHGDISTPSGKHYLQKKHPPDRVKSAVRDGTSKKTTSP
jgi:hypothetical protein